MTATPTSPLALQTILQARRRIDGVIRATPLIHSAALSARAGCEVWLKLECQQLTGSFKLRGAANKLLQLTEAERARGVIAVSSGNHGRAVAYMAQRLGIRAVICLSTLVPENKRAAIRGYGADLRVEGNTQVAAQDYAERLIASEGLTWISPFDDLQVIAGQGTIATDILRDNPGIDTIIAPLSGGGLLGGIALAAKAVSPTIEVIGASMTEGPGMVACLQAGKLVDVDEAPSLADALAGSVGMDNVHTFPIIRDFMDRYTLTPETALAPAMRLLLETEGLVMEGGSAVALAALLQPGTLGPRNRQVCVVISGRNIAPERFLKAVQSAGAMP